MMHIEGFSNYMKGCIHLQVLYKNLYTLQERMVLNLCIVVTWQMSTRGGVYHANSTTHSISEQISTKCSQSTERAVAWLLTSYFLYKIVLVDHSLLLLLPLRADLISPNVGQWENNAGAEKQVPLHLSIQQQQQIDKVGSFCALYALRTLSPSLYFSFCYSAA